MADDPTRTRSRNAWPCLLVLGLAAVLFLARLGDRSLWSMELRWAQIPREMLRTGQWFRPTINGQLYYDKPLGSYWLVVLSALCRGGCDETAARLPGALAGLLAVGLLMVLARKLHGSATAWRAGLILATCFSMVFFARHASADLLNLAGTMLALVLFVCNRQRPDVRWLLPFWLVLALTSLTKGLLGFVLPLLIIGVYCSFPSSSEGPAAESPTGLAGFCRRQRWLLNGKTLLALPLAVGVYLLPFLISAIQHGDHSGLALVWRENLQRFVAPHNHRGPIYLYAGAIWVLLAPWSLLLPAALFLPSPLVGEGSGVRGPANRLFTRVFFWTILIFFTLARSRRSYYLLPVLPAGALLVAELLAQEIETLGGLARRLLRLGLLGLLLIVAGCLLAFLPLQALLPAPWCDLPAPPAAAGGIGCCLVSLVLLLRAWRRLQRGRLILALGAASFLAWFYLFVLAAPEAEAYRAGRAFALQVRACVAGQFDRLALFRTREPVFYLDAPRPLLELSCSAEVDAAVRAHGIRWLVGRQRDVEAAGLAGRICLRERSFPWESEAIREGKLVLLQCAGGIAQPRPEEPAHSLCRRLCLFASRPFFDRSFFDRPFGDVNDDLLLGFAAHLNFLPIDRRELLAEFAHLGDALRVCSFDRDVQVDRVRSRRNVLHGEQTIAAIDRARVTLRSAGGLLAGEGQVHCLILWDPERGPILEQTPQDLDAFGSARPTADQTERHQAQNEGAVTKTESRTHGIVVPARVHGIIRNQTPSRVGLPGKGQVKQPCPRCKTEASQRGQDQPARTTNREGPPQGSCATSPPFQVASPM